MDTVEAMAGSRSEDFRDRIRALRNKIGIRLDAITEIDLSSAIVARVYKKCGLASKTFGEPRQELQFDR